MDGIGELERGVFLTISGRLTKSGQVLGNDREHLRVDAGGRGSTRPAGDPVWAARPNCLDVLGRCPACGSCVARIMVCGAPRWDLLGAGFTDHRTGRSKRWYQRTPR